MKLRVSRSSLKLTGCSIPHILGHCSREAIHPLQQRFLGNLPNKNLVGQEGQCRGHSSLGSQLVHVIFSLERGTKRAPGNKDSR